MPCWIFTFSPCQGRARANFKLYLPSHLSFRFFCPQCSEQHANARASNEVCWIFNLKLYSTSMFTRTELSCHCTNTESKRRLKKRERKSCEAAKILFTVNLHVNNVYRCTHSHVSVWLTLPVVVVLLLCCLVFYINSLNLLCTSR